VDRIERKARIKESYKNPRKNGQIKRSNDQSKETIHQGKERRKHMERTNRREVRVQEKGTNEQGATKA
jgi:hypothetical protein